MPNNTTPTKTLMIIVEEILPETNPRSYEFVYVGDLDTINPDYTTLNNLPQINGITLTGNKSSSDLGINIPSVINDLTTGGSDKALSAEMGKEIGENKVDYNIIDIVQTTTPLDNFYIRYSSGQKVTAGVTGQFKLYYFNCQNIQKIRCYLGSLDTVPAAVAFYSSDINIESVNIGTYMSSESVQMIAGTNWYDVIVPVHAKYVCISNRGVNVSNPIIIAYENTAYSKINSAIDDYDKKVLFSRNNSTPTSSSISATIDCSAMNIGTQIEIDITEIGGDSLSAINLYNQNCTWILSRQLVVGKLFLDYDGSFNRIVVTKYACENNIFNLTISEVKDASTVNRIQPNYLPSKPVELSLGTPFQGYYNITTSDDAENNIYSTSTWVSYPIQKTNGYIVNVNCSDFSTYYVNFQIWNDNLTSFIENRITQTTNIDTTGFPAWSIDFRRIDRQNITPSDVSDVITCTKIENGTEFERPVLHYELNKEVSRLDNLISSEIIEPAEKALSISKEGYAINAFANSPYYYHYSANDFLRGIIDNTSKKIIASESIEDIEVAARLGFKFIEANIHQTADTQPTFVCIHGTSGMFGAEAKLSPTHTDSTLTTDSDVQNITIASKTLQWIKENIIYNSDVAKYQTTIPSLDEFCIACKEYNIGIFAGTGNNDAINTCVKYLGNNVIIYNPPTNIRNFFNGYVFLWRNSATATVEGILSSARLYGAPCMIGLGPTARTSLSSRIGELISTLHNEGYLIGFAYATEEEGRECFELGYDFGAANSEVNPFIHNYEIFDMDDENQSSIFGNSANNGTITLNINDTITCGSSNPLPLGKASLTIKFNGTLEITFGSKGRRTITSDGTKTIVITDYFLRRATTLTVKSTINNTVISSLVYKTSKC